MVEIRIRPNSQPPTDDEVAACVAAISVIVSESETVEEPSRIPVSSWKNAALLEGVGKVRRIYGRPSRPIAGNLWKTRKLFAIGATIGILSALCGPSARADQFDAQNVLQPKFADDPNLPQLAPNRFDQQTNMQMPPEAPPTVVQQTDIVNRKHSARGLQPPAVLRPEIPVPSQAPAVAAPVANDLGDVMPQVWPNGQPQAPKYIRVGLSFGAATGAVSLPDGAQLKDATTGDVLAELPPQSDWKVAVRSPGGFSQLSFSGHLNNVAHSRVMIASRNPYRNVAFAPGSAPTDTTMVPIPPSASPQFWLPLFKGAQQDSSAPTSRVYVVVPPADGAFGIGNKLYRGSLMLRPSGSGLNLINYVPLEDYVLSVVPSEMPSGWPLEALKAQAIAARSYALANLGKHEADGYDVRPTDEDQVYNGVQSESDASNRAVAETDGEIIKYDGQVVTAYFHSTSGGCTELAENVWSRPVPFLKAVPDYDDDSPHFSWTRSLSTANIESILSKNGKSVGALLAMVPVARGTSPRVRFMMVNGSARSIMISGEDARRMFGLPSSCFNVGGGSATYVFAGRGFGHGLGMSQWGAKKLAESGYSAGQILSYYYKDITVDRL